jgi:hypothetical protein
MGILSRLKKMMSGRDAADHSEESAVDAETEGRHGLLGPRPISGAGGIRAVSDPSAEDVIREAANPEDDGTMTSMIERERRGFEGRE